MFEKKTIVFNNKMIEQNIDLVMEQPHPYSNADTAPELDEPNSEETPKLPP